MITLGIVLASVAAYFLIGWLLMQHDMPALWARARRHWCSEEHIVGQVHSGAVTTLLLWPFRLPFLLAAEAAVKGDPARLEREIRERDAKITELERQLFPDRPRPRLSDPGRRRGGRI